MKAKNDKGPPHLTNLTEDVQLSGKVFYSLEKCMEYPMSIGRHDGDPYPEIILRGVGIQKNHAQITLSNKGQFNLLIRGKESWE